MQIYYDNFSSLQDVCDAFCISKDLLKGARVIYASYETADYEGGAHVIYLKQGKIYEVYGSHCSCFGLEDQWEPEETNLNALLMRKLSEQARLALTTYFKHLLAFL